MVELSIIIPTRDRPALLRICLRSLARQVAGHDEVEVVVVDDGSTQDPRPVISAAFPEAHVIRQSNAGPGAARNRGAEAARGGILLFLDDDVVPADGLLAAHLAVHRSGDRVVGLGRMILVPHPSAGPSGKTLRGWWQDHYRRLAVDPGRPTFMDCYSGNLSLARDAFFAAGAFSEDLPHSEDVELGFRLHSLGLRFAYLPDALGHQRFGKGFRAFVADAEAAGRAAVELYRRHPAMLPALPLGGYSQARLAERVLRRATLAVPATRGAILALEPLLGRTGWRRGWYGFARRAWYWAGVRSRVADPEVWERLTSGTTILLYHAFGAPGEATSEWVVPIDRFAQQLRWLQRRGFRFLRLDEYVALRRQHVLPPRRSVLVTIDDGYADVCRAVPVLERLGVPATVFLVTGLVGRTNGWDLEGVQAGRPLLAWDQIKELASDRLDFGAHSRTHRHLAGLPAAEIDHEIAGSRRDLDRELGRSVTTFAYPFGEFGPDLEAAVSRAGFTSALGSRPTANSAAQPDLQLQRIAVRGTDSLLRFALVLTVGDARWTRRLSIGRWLDQLGPR